MVFDILSELESYENSFPEIRNVIDIMDRSLPYKKGEGTYSCPENDRVTYSVNEILTSDKGISFNVEANHSALIITLEGEQVVSSNDVDKVFILSEGRFLLVNEGVWRMAMTPNLPAQIKYCIFNW